MHGERTQDHVTQKHRKDKAQEQYWNVFTHADRDGRRPRMGTENIRYCVSAPQTIRVAPPD